MIRAEGFLHEVNGMLSFTDGGLQYESCDADGGRWAFVLGTIVFIFSRNDW